MLKQRISMLFLASLLMGLFTNLQAQDDDFDDFDPSMFEEAGDALKSYCTNKVLGQAPSPLISFGVDMQGPATIGQGDFGAYPASDTDFGPGFGFRFVSNVPIVSKNNILINWGFNYVQFKFHPSQDNIAGPLTENLRASSLNWLNTNFTIFKPLNDKRFLLFQLGGELNGDYSWSDLPEIGNLRVPAAFIYGFKPNDRFIWGPGVSRTYLGGALNYLPIIYYYQTFKNDHWGVEALFPARIQARYRWNSRSLLLMGYQVEGATYRMSRFGENLTLVEEVANQAANAELRRSEIRLGMTYNRGINDFIWVGVQAGYRINYSFNVDDGEFYRGFDDAGYLLENTLTNTWFAQFTISMVSP